MAFNSVDSADDWSYNDLRYEEYGNFAVSPYQGHHGSMVSYQGDATPFDFHTSESAVPSFSGITPNLAEDNNSNLVYPLNMAYTTCRESLSL